ncbi:E3 ubiquitin-protein ligase Arkadia [Fistulifera solaris]|uniref:E3 ubiquitin-protein ligase Arkadia n=1 Tax=Fistulifera solaris TaxID=1519565 RepID=A0A1Z5JWW3_FISSO|nr:E3 ubiquitin-protein ligase Arkadia [Fistulifera solaris]|eukprot:GAX18308.1 E3 ubiquitin-protein ligase Arkadia [Fistulifera solaris]
MENNDAVTEMVRCQECGHVVPASNITIHQLRGCREARRRSTEREPSNFTTENVETMDVDSDDEDDRKMEAEVSTEQSAASNPITRPSIPATVMQNNAFASVAGRNSADPISIPESPPPRNREVVDLVDGDDDEVQEIWPCPGCTFHNSMSNTICEICSAMRPDSRRMPEPTRRDRGNGDSPIRLMSGGALLGSLVGGAAAYMRGRPMSSGMIQGALSGAVGGAFANELFRSDILEAPDMAAAPRVVRTVRRRGPYGTTTVTTYMSHGAPATRRRRTGDPVMDHLLQMILAGNANRQMNIDGMNYEQLLEAFGDGTENRGADEGDIRSLPVSTVTDTSTIPNDHSDCMICLETFKVGDERKTLPCLHGFHSACVDKWLRTSASCPVCKYSIRS